ncbi:PREDICTED: glycosyltransferase 25 family member-like [Acropora digitifera]|uniref:glycosyltransferase 25 family member-like n=1 Tax=Acropora digitifera TaxID=70779 RepID=UPI00077AE6FF|nr:PREDICTED: glycosyltransferase 25 family member-like [Acropora digitifera]
MGIKMLPGYNDPYGKRPLTMGEIGCFLSHYLIWQEMINNGLSQVLILEDDVRFEPNFRNQLRGLLMEATTLSSRYRWELM